MTLPFIEHRYCDDAAAETDEVKQARELVQRALTLARRTKVSARAEAFLVLAADNLRHPAPRMLRDIVRMPDKERESVDWGNAYVTTEEWVELAGISRTTIRTLVNEGYLRQQYRGLYRVHDLFEAWREYQARPR